VAPRRQWSVTPEQFRWLALGDLAGVILIVLTGAAVRLTGSGLGCPDWPTCYTNQLTGPLPVHAAIEYSNRGVTAALEVIVGVSLVAAWCRAPRRSDLLWLNAGLVGGIVADAILGEFVVYSKLNPWLVSAHLLISLAMVAVAAVLYHRATHQYAGAAPVVRDARIAHLARWLWVPFVAVVLSGTVTTGSGPHAGNSQGQDVARRLPIAFADAARLHGTLGTLFLVAVLALLVTAYRTHAPRAVLVGVERLAAATALQAALGLTQYALHVPVALVEIHVFGAVALTVGVVQLTLRQVARPFESEVSHRLALAG
jgi:heme a synthase